MRWPCNMAALGTCVICDCTDVKRAIKVGGKSWVQQHLPEKITYIADREAFQSIEATKSVICVTCVGKVDGAFNVAKRLRSYRTGATGDTESGPEERSPRKTVAKKMKYGSPIKSRIPLPLQPQQQQQQENVAQSTPSLASVRKQFLDSISQECVAIGGLLEPSCLRANTKPEHLRRADFLDICYRELKKRCPSLHDVLLIAAASETRNPPEAMVGPMAMVYGVLMFLRNKHLSAFQRAFTMIMTKGSITSKTNAVCNKLGLTLSTTARINLLDECAEEPIRKAREMLDSCCLCNLVGDNLDLRIRPRTASEAHPIQDCHFFALILIFSRLSSEMMATKSNLPPTVTTDDLYPQRFLLSGQERDKLLGAYAVLLGRLMAKNLPAFQWLKGCLPQHIPHSLEDVTAKKSFLIPMKLVFKDEKKYEHCMTILRESQDLLQEIFEDAPVSLADIPPPFFGDQLTRTRLEGAKGLLSMSRSEDGRIDKIGPVVCTLWHIKQDFLEKAYKSLWKPGSASVKGSLMSFKNTLHRAYVNGKVKGNYRAHEELLLAVGEQYLLMQVMQSLQMEDEQAWPQGVPKDVERLTASEKTDLGASLLKDHLLKWQYLAHSDQTQSETDWVYNHACNICHWTLHLLNLNDLAQEGDVDRAVLSLKANLPFFFQHSHLSKYFTECLDFLLKTEVTSSPKMRMRILEGSFVNRRGGRGNNVETDLIMEHSIRNRKELIRGLIANKTERSIQRVNLAADTVNDIHKAFEEKLHLPLTGSHQSSQLRQEDAEAILACLKELKPFHHERGRDYGCMHIPVSPLSEKVLREMKISIAATVGALTEGVDVCQHESDKEESEEEEDFDDED